MSPSFLVGTSSKTPDSGWRTIGRTECKNKCPWNQNLKFNSMTKIFFGYKYYLLHPKSASITTQKQDSVCWSSCLALAWFLPKKSGIISLVNLGQSVGCGDWQLKVLQPCANWVKKNSTRFLATNTSTCQPLHLEKKWNENTQELGIWFSAALHIVRNVFAIGEH